MVTRLRAQTRSRADSTGGALPVRAKGSLTTEERNPEIRNPELAARYLEHGKRQARREVLFCETKPFLAVRELRRCIIRTYGKDGLPESLRNVAFRCETLQNVAFRCESLRNVAFGCVRLRISARR